MFALRLSQLGKVPCQREQAGECGLGDQAGACARRRRHGDTVGVQIQIDLAVRAGRVHLHPLQCFGLAQCVVKKLGGG